MRKIALILLVILLFEPNSAQAFLWFGKKSKTQDKPKVLINEEVLIHGKFKGQGSPDQVLSQILELRLAIHIPRDSDELTITTLYDEASENPIEQITWVREGKNRGIVKTHPYKIEEIVNHKLEELSINYNPSLAYDRITEGKHVINKSFIFKQSDAIGDREKPIAHFLELQIPAKSGAKIKRIRIDNKLYYQEPQIITTIPGPHEIKQSKRKRKEEEAKRQRQLQQEQALQSQRQAQLRAEHEQEMADLQYAIQQMNGAGEGYSEQQLNPTQFRQEQIQQQIDAFGPDTGGDYDEDIY